MTPVQSYIQAGIKPVAESDHGTEPYSRPLWNIERYVARTDAEGRVWGSQEKVSREQALWMYTNWAAYYTGEEKTLGTIEAGKLADLVVLEKDYMTVPENEISDIPVLMTVVRGKVVYEMPGRL